MSKMLEATCVAGVVTSDGVPVPAAEILSEGVKASEGILLLEGDKAKYVTSNASDIKDLISSLEGILDQTITILTAVDTAAAAGQAANIAALGTLKTALGVSKENLK